IQTNVSVGLGRRTLFSRLNEGSSCPRTRASSKWRRGDGRKDWIPACAGMTEGKCGAIQFHFQTTMEATDQNKNAKAGDSPSEIERLKEDLRREHDMYLRALAD